ncbi:hypothetical protein GCM10011374_03260 [Kocuria dechangensis]|uniref:Uncharacterized protein n=1 Tax=Kocuria dechangensis TaxID=1176249 RepID=A0A917GG85_9MICC|nr:hypothetical protein [Kocuria dechangensis]GGG44294.1 hypothetical protein GCM10011374_03260 [Kocuria dechangensis]
MPRARVRPWSWHDDNSATPGAMIMTEDGKESRQVFIPIHKITAISDQLIDILEQYEAKEQ